MNRNRSPSVHCKCCGQILKLKRGETLIQAKECINLTTLQVREKRNGIKEYSISGRNLEMIEVERGE